MVDPRERDPRFPNRPFTDDFFLLSEIIQEHDQAAEGTENPFDLIDVDQQSLMYVIENRLGIFSQRMPLPSRLQEMLSPILQAVYIDAFALGLEFGQRRIEEEEGGEGG